MQDTRLAPGSAPCNSHAPKSLCMQTQVKSQEGRVPSTARGKNCRYVGMALGQIHSEQSLRQGFRCRWYIKGPLSKETYKRGEQKRKGKSSLDPIQGGFWSINSTIEWAPLPQSGAEG